EAYTFDDVLLKPGLSDILPSEADIRSQLTRSIPLNIPIIASAMDTVTEARMAIAMAQAGGIGVIHRNFDVDGQAAQVRQVKKFESGMVVNPLTIGPDAMLSDALALMNDHGFSGIPVVTGAAKGVPGKLVGILTNRDVRFATDPRQKISELMTHENLVTVRQGVSQDEAKRMLHKHRIKRLSNAVQVIAGNVATKEGTQALIDAGADAIKVGIGPGSICTTRIVAGVGVPQLTAIMDAVEAAKKVNVPIIADGGIKYSG